MSDYINSEMNFNRRKELPFFINYFRLRPELSYSLVSFIILLALVYNFVLPEKKIDESEFVNLGQFEMVELKVVVPEAAEPEIKVEEEKVVIKAKNNMKFGDDSGKYDPSALAATLPSLKVSPPAYPAGMSKLGVEGVVVIELGIDENGSVVYGKIVKSLHPVLDKHVLEWAKSASFYPAIGPDNKPFKCQMFLPIKFQLQ
jgi:TonB family protein